MNDIEEKIESPCVRNCCLDDNDICLGCHRTINEITSWASMSTEEQNDVLGKARKRATIAREQGDFKE